MPTLLVQAMYFEWNKNTLTGILLDTRTSSELPNSTSYRSPVSVATAIDDMAETIVIRAAQRAKEAIEKVGHRGVRHHWRSK